MLAGLLLNIHGVTAGGHDAAENERLYWLLLQRNRERRLAARRAEFERSEQARREELAQQAYQAAKSARPELAEQVVKPFTARKPDSPRYEVDWGRIVADIAAYECLCALMIEIDEDDLLVILASES